MLKIKAWVGVGGGGGGRNVWSYCVSVPPTYLVHSKRSNPENFLRTHHGVVGT